MAPYSGWIRFSLRWVLQIFDALASPRTVCPGHKTQTWKKQYYKVHTEQELGSTGKPMWNYFLTSHSSGTLTPCSWYVTCPPAPSITLEIQHSAVFPCHCYREPSDITYIEKTAIIENFYTDLTCRFNWESH